MNFPRALIDAVWQTAQNMVADGLAHRAQGNVSTRDPQSGLIAVTPSAIPYDRLQPEDIAIVNLDGEIARGVWKPTSELALHLAFYQAHPDLGAVVHTHSPYATLFAAIAEPLPIMLTEAAACVGGAVPLAPYCRPGTQELAEVTVRAAGFSPAVLLANHGLVTVGPDLGTAYDSALAVEAAARTAWMARVMGAKVQPMDEKEAAELRAAYLLHYKPAKPDR